MKWIHQKKIDKLIINKDLEYGEDELIYSSPIIEKDIRKLILYIIILKDHLPETEDNFMKLEYRTREWTVILYKYQRENYILGVHIYVKLLSILGYPIKVIRAKYYWEKNLIGISWSG